MKNRKINKATIIMIIINDKGKDNNNDKDPTNKK